MQGAELTINLTNLSYAILLLVQSILGCGQPRGAVRRAVDSLKRIRTVGMQSRTANMTALLSARLLRILPSLPWHLRRIRPACRDAAISVGRPAIVGIATGRSDLVIAVILRPGATS